jgi:hypothetical protein
MPYVDVLGPSTRRRRRARQLVPPADVGLSCSCCSRGGANHLSRDQPRRCAALRRRALLERHARVVVLEQVLRAVGGGCGGSSTRWAGAEPGLQPGGPATGGLRDRWRGPRRGPRQLWGRVCEHSRSVLPGFRSRRPSRTFPGGQVRSRVVPLAPFDPGRCGQASFNSLHAGTVDYCVLDLDCSGGSSRRRRGDSVAGLEEPRRARSGRSLATSPHGHSAAGPTLTSRVAGRPAPGPGKEVAGLHRLGRDDGRAEEGIDAGTNRRQGFIGSPICVSLEKKKSFIFSRVRLASDAASAP